MVFTGATDRDTVNQVVFAEKIYTTGIRVYPQEWEGGVIGMRMEVQGCNPFGMKTYFHIQSSQSCKWKHQFGYPNPSLVLIVRIWVQQYGLVIFDYQNIVCPLEQRIILSKGIVAYTLSAHWNRDWVYGKIENTRLHIFVEITFSSRLYKRNWHYFLLMVGNGHF